MIIPFIKQTFRSIFMSPLNIFLTISVIIVVVFISGLLLMLLNTVSENVIKSKNTLLVQVYWKKNISDKQLENDWKLLKNDKGVISLQTYTPAEALNFMNDKLENTIDKNTFNASIFPGAALIEYKLLNSNANISDIIKQIKLLPNVNKVAYDQAQAKEFIQWVSFVDKITIPIFIILISIIVLVVRSTVKLSLLSKSQEIQILEMVGASPFYVRLPITLAILVQSLVAGLFAIGCLFLVYKGIKPMLSSAPLLLNVSFLTLDKLSIMLVILGLTASICAYFVSRSYSLHK